MDIVSVLTSLSLMVFGAAISFMAAWYWYQKKLQDEKYKKLEDMYDKMEKKYNELDKDVLILKQKTG